MQKCIEVQNVLNCFDWSHHNNTKLLKYRKLHFTHLCSLCM